MGMRRGESSGALMLARQDLGNALPTLTMTPPGVFHRGTGGSSVQLPLLPFFSLPPFHFGARQVADVERTDNATCYSLLYALPPGGDDAVGGLLMKGATPVGRRPFNWRA